MFVAAWDRYKCPYEAGPLKPISPGALIGPIILLIRALKEMTTNLEEKFVQMINITSPKWL